ncbi:MAG: hypothetical protein M1147_00025 [Nitrospirae bacterium]|nr:hypothetical protein [Nitrospirota bacterium]MCL5976500.1 hypothetical protein [Nitrospirota bacterium]
MKILLNLAAMAIAAMALAGCGTATQEIKAKSESEQTDVFSEVKEDEIIPKGFADIIIKSSIKTHLEKHYLVELKDTLHGKPIYPFLINIDGQSAIWEVKSQVEDIPEYADGGQKNPEGGKGMRYILNKRIRLKPGLHRIFFGLPGENRSKEFAITTEDGRVYNLEIKPIYNRYRYEGSRFERGVDRIEVFLNGIPIQ